MLLRSLEKYETTNLVRNKQRGKRPCIIIGLVCLVCCPDTGSNDTDSLTRRKGQAWMTLRAVVRPVNE